MGKYQLNGREKRARSSGTFPRLRGAFLLSVLTTPSLPSAFAVLAGLKFPAAQQKEKHLQGAPEEAVALPALGLQLSPGSSRAHGIKAQHSWEPLGSGRAAPWHRCPAGTPWHRAAHPFCNEETPKSPADVLGITESDAEGFVCVWFQPPQTLELAGVPGSVVLTSGVGPCCLRPRGREAGEPLGGGTPCPASLGGCTGEKCPGQASSVTQGRVSDAHKAFRQMKVFWGSREGPILGGCAAPPPQLCPQQSPCCRAVRAPGCWCQEAA